MMDNSTQNTDNNKLQEYKLMLPEKVITYLKTIIQEKGNITDEQLFLTLLKESMEGEPEPKKKQIRIWTKKWKTILLLFAILGFLFFLYKRGLLQNLIKKVKVTSKEVIPQL